jgi:hypothetical protein
MTDPASTQSTRLGSRNLCAVHWRNMFVLIDDGTALPHEYRQPERLAHEQARQFPEGIGCLIVVPEGSRVPSPATRKEIGEALDRVSSRFLGFSWVIEGRGFGPAAHRSVLSGIALLRKTPYATHVSSNVSVSLAWLLPRILQGPLTPDDLSGAMNAIARARARYRMA